MAYQIEINTDTKEGKVLLIALFIMSKSKEININGLIIDGTTKSIEEIYSLIENEAR